MIYGHEHDKPAFRVPVLQFHASYVAQQARAAYSTPLYREHLAYEIVGMQRLTAVLYSVARDEYRRHSVI
jgi:hypothetical protein